MVLLKACPICKLPVTFEWRRDDNYEVVQSIKVNPTDFNSPYNNKKAYEKILKATSPNIVT